MALTNTPTLMSLDQYAEILQRQPDHFNQAYSLAFPVHLSSSAVFYQYGWNHDGHVSRDQIARTIAEAEQIIANELGYWPAPKYVTNEQTPHVYPRTSPLAAYCIMTKPDVNLRWGHFLAGGCRALLPIEAGVDITSARTDTDDDGWDESFSFDVVHADASSWAESSIGVFAADDPTDEQHRIRHLTVAIDGDTITISGRASLFIKMVEWNKNVALNGDDDSIYLEAVDVYRIYTISDEDNPPVEFGWESRTEATQYATSQGVLQAVELASSRVGVVPAEWDATTEVWTRYSSPSIALCTPPKVVRYNYLAGWPRDSQGRVAPPLDRAIAALATARLTGPISGGGESIDKIYPYWQEVPTGKTVYATQVCPFGPQRGAWDAWNTVQSMLQADGFSL